MTGVITLDDVNLDGRTVLLRVDINSPLDPKTKSFLDNNRIKMIVPTLNRLTKSKVVILAHQSRPGKMDFTSTHGHSRELARLLGRQVKWVEDIHGDAALKAIESLQPGEVLMLDNVRKDEQEMSMKKESFDLLADSQMVSRLSGVADAFVNDAFACAHRNSPSITGFTHVLPCIAGVLMELEINKLTQALENPKRPCIALLGGIKIDDSVKVADNMLRNNICDQLWVTGGVANLFLEVSGVDIGECNHNFLYDELGEVWNPTMETARYLWDEYSDRIMLPVDIAADISGNRVDLRIEDLPIEAPIYDLGLDSTRILSRAIKDAGTIILNGPAGVFEMPEFALGTIEMLNACSESEGYSVIGGGHTATLVMQRGLARKMGHVSTGGGSCLDLLAGRTLPAIESLKSSASRFEMSVHRPIDHR